MTQFLCLYVAIIPHMKIYWKTAVFIIKFDVLFFFAILGEISKNSYDYEVYKENWHFK